MPEVMHGAALLAEASALFAIWNWRRRSRSVLWLISGAATLISLSVVITLLAEMIQPQRLLTFFAVYLLAGLAWAWSFERLHMPDWKIGEYFIALLALIMVGLANIPEPGTVAVRAEEIASLQATSSPTAF